MNTTLYSDSVHGTSIVFNGVATVNVKVAIPGSFGCLSMLLDLDDVDRLLALREHAVAPEHDLAEFFREVCHCPERPAMRAAEAFVIAAPGLAEILR